MQRTQRSVAPFITCFIVTGALYAALDVGARANQPENVLPPQQEQPTVNCDEENDPVSIAYGL